jgi:2-enoate reductase
MVVGGGPAGMEFARIATLRKHDVTIYEKGSRLGGYIPLATALPNLNTHDVQNISRWLRKEMKKLSIKIELNTDVTSDLVQQINPDLVVLATGAKEIIPQIPGIDNPMVGTLDEFLSGKRKAGKKIAVIGGHYGAEIAVSLARDGKSKPVGYTKCHNPANERTLTVENPDKVREVTLIEEGAMIGWPPFFQVQRYMVINEFLVEDGVTCLTNTRISRISGNMLTVVNAEGTETSLEVDTVILALSRLGNRDLYHQLAGAGIQLREIGDCTGPEKVEKAIVMANFLARQL